MRDAPNVRLRCQTTRSSETTKGVSSYRQQDGVHGKRVGRGEARIQESGGECVQELIELCVVVQLLDECILKLGAVVDNFLQSFVIQVAAIFEEIVQMHLIGIHQRREAMVFGDGVDTCAHNRFFAMNESMRIEYQAVVIGNCAFGGVLCLQSGDQQAYPKQCRRNFEGVFWVHGF